jgi:hypothetical protein
MIVTSFLSLVISLTATVCIPSVDETMIDRADMIMGWIGMIWSWPGILCYFVLRYGENLSKGKAIGVVLAVLLVTILGWVFPIIFPSLF